MQKITTSGITGSTTILDSCESVMGMNGISKSIFPNYKIFDSPGLFGYPCITKQIQIIE